MIHCNSPAKSDRVNGQGGATNASPCPDQHRTVKGFKMAAKALIIPIPGEIASAGVIPR